MTSPATTAPTTPYTPAGVDPVVRRAYEIFNARDFAAIPTVYADDAEITVVPTGQTLRGAAGVESFMRGWLAAFGDARAEIDLLAQAGDVAVCEFHGVGTHTGPFATPMGELPATGRRVNVPFCDVIRVRDGRVAAIRTYFDAATFVGQLGG